MENELYVVVSIAENGVIHAWGDSNGQPFPTKAKAHTEYNNLEAIEKYTYDEVTTKFKVCKILGQFPKQTNRD